MIKKLFKGALTLAALGALVGVGVYAVGGKNRFHAMATKVQTDVQAAIDRHVDEPTALRHQLMEMERDYPKRIAKVRGDLGQLGEHVRQLERDQAISAKVVQLVDADLELLQPAVAQAAAAASQGTVRPAAVRFDDKLLSFDRAQKKLEQLEQTKLDHSDRAYEADRQLAFLRKQQELLEQTLMRFESEFSSFRVKRQELERKVETIHRNQELAKMLEDYRKSRESYDRYESPSLDGYISRMDGILKEQEATLEQLVQDERQVSYEERARMELDSRNRRGSLDGLDIDGLDELPEAGTLRSASDRR